MTISPWPLATNIEEIHDEKIRFIATRSFKIATLAASKAALYSAKPSAMPIGGRSGSFALERAFLDRFKSLPADKRKLIVSRTQKFTANSTVMRRRYGGLAEVVKLDRKKSIALQARRLPYTKLQRIPKQYIANMEVQNAVQHYSTTEELKRRMIDRIPEYVAPEPNTRLDLRINKVLCLDETGWIESGSDEIKLGGTVVDCVGQTTKIPAFKVKSFKKDGDEKSYNPPKVFHTFDLLQGEGFPKTFFTILVLAEVDMGGVAGFLNQLVDALVPIIANELAKATGYAVGAIVGGLAGPIVAAVLSIVIGWVVGAVVNWLKEWWGDDIFPPCSQLLEIPSLHYTIPEDVVGIAGFSGHHGTYQVHYSWRLYKR